MQSQYVMRDDDKIDFLTAVELLEFIQKKLLENPSWKEYRII